MRSLALIAAMLSAPACAAYINKAMVEKLLAASDQAILKKDVDALGRLMSPDVKITLTVNIEGRRETTTMSKARHLLVTKLVMGEEVIWKYERKSLGVEIVSPGKKAISKDITGESKRLNGQSFLGVNLTTTTVELVNNVPTITSIDYLDCGLFKN